MIADAFNPFAENPLRTRADLLAAMENLFEPLRPSFSPGGARVRIDASGAVFDQVAAELEGYARPLWGLAAAAAGGLVSDHWPMFRRGLENGTDPDHPEFWGVVGPVDQRQVELAAIGFALCVAKPALWDPLSETAKARVITYLTQARTQPFSDNNWKFFRLMIDLGLVSVGAVPSADLHDAYLDEIEAFAVGEGWYSDGATEQRDHYIPFAFHFYGLLYAHLSTGRPERSARFRARARAFAPDFEHWFADDGAALPFGRSLTYRFAACGFWAALAFAGEEALPWGVIKGHYLRHMRWWSRQPITRRDGLLTIGYAYPNPLIAENYNSAQSPWWAFKAFLPLALADDHPFWAAEEAGPVQTRDVPRLIVEPGMLIRHEPGQTVTLSSGQSNANIRFSAEKYGKFAYSTAFAFSIESDARKPDAAVLDNMLGLIDTDGDLRVRGACELVSATTEGLLSRWRPWPDVNVETWLAWDGPFQIRRHRIETARDLRTIEGGFAIALDPSTAIPGLRPDAAAATYRSPAGFTGIASLDDAARQGRLLRAEPNTNLISPRTVVPQLTGRLDAGRHEVVCAVLASPTGPAAQSLWRGRFPD